MRDRTGEPDAFQHLLQRLSVAIQRGITQSQSWGPSSQDYISFTSDSI